MKILYIHRLMIKGHSKLEKETGAASINKTKQNHNMDLPFKMKKNCGKLMIWNEYFWINQYPVSFLKVFVQL